MIQASAQLIALLQSRNYYRMDLYTLTLADGETFYYSGGDVDLTYNGHLYGAGGFTGPYWGKNDNRSTIHQKLGTEVDTFTVTVLPGSSTFKGLSWGEANRVGLFDGAMLLYSRAYFALPITWPLTPVGVIDRFYGNTGANDGGGAELVFSVNSLMGLLQKPWPHVIVSPRCQNHLGDSACGLSVAAYQVTGSVLAGSTSVMINTNLGQASGYFNQGILAMTSGASQGFSVTVDNWTNGQLTLESALPFAPAVGDTFTLLPGCDKSFGPQGCSKFANSANFRGFPDVPQPQTAQ